MLFSFLSSQSQKPGLQTHATLRGSSGPINALALTDDGKLLASGGDEELVRIWDIDEQRAVDVLSDRLGRWGQITSIKWLGKMTLAETYTICFGTGRGMLLVYTKVKDADTYRELASVNPFAYNDPVEAVDYNAQHNKLVTCSHGGKVVMYNLNKKGTPDKAWMKNISDTESGRGTISRSVHFTPGGDAIIVCGLESGIVFSKTVTSGVDTWNKQLKSSIGSSRLSPSGNHLLIDNLDKGFDLYTYPTLTLSESFEIDRSQVQLHDATFIEGSNMIACGSDHGRVYIFSCKTALCEQRLRVGTKSSIIQTVDAISSSEYHYLAAGTSDEKSEIVVWRKPIRVVRPRKPSKRGCSLTMVVLILNASALIVIFALLAGKSGSQGTWSMEGLLSQLRSISNEAETTPKTVVEPVFVHVEPEKRREDAKDAFKRFEERMAKQGVDLNKPDWAGQLKRLDK